MATVGRDVMSAPRVAWGHIIHGLDTAICGLLLLLFIKGHLGAMLTREALALHPPKPLP